MCNNSNIVYTCIIALLGTGSVDSVGQGRGTFYSVNVPLKDGICDQAFTQLFARYVFNIKYTVELFLTETSNKRFNFL